jgi:hypothetical protein
MLELGELSVARALTRVEAWHQRTTDLLEDEHIALERARRALEIARSASDRPSSDAP